MPPLHTGKKVIHNAVFRNSYNILNPFEEMEKKREENKHSMKDYEEYLRANNIDKQNSNADNVIYIYIYNV